MTAFGPQEFVKAPSKGKKKRGKWKPRKRTSTVDFSAPASSGTWFLTLTRPGNALARVKLNGRTVVGPLKLLGTRHVRLGIQVQASNRLEVQILGKGSVSLRVDGVVPEADLPPGVGRRVAELTLFERKVLGQRPPAAGQTLQVPLPTTEGLFTLRWENGDGQNKRSKVFFSSVRWNGERLFRLWELLGFRTSAEAPLAVHASNTLRVLAWGGSGSFLTIKVRGHVVDEDPPTVGFLHPADGSQVDPEDQVELRFADSLSGVLPSSLRVTLNGTDVTSAFTLGDGVATAKIEELGSSLAQSNVLRAWVRDRACNEGQASVAFTVGTADTTPPVLSVTRPSPGSCVGAAESIALSFSDADSGIDPASLQVTLNGVDVTAALTRTSGTAEGTLSSLPPAALVEGTSLLVATVRDTAGNQATAQITFQLDLTPPSLTLTPGGGSVVPSGSSVSLVASYSDGGAPGCGVDLSGFRATLDGQDVSSSFMIGPTNAKAEITSLTAGSHTWSVTVRDLAGNETQRTETFTVVAVPAALQLSIGPARSARTPPDETPLLTLAPEARNPDGSGNDLSNPQEGAAGAQLLRVLQPAYGDGISTPAGANRRSPREISNAVHAQGGSRLNRRRASDFLWLWGQFVDHDIDLSSHHSPPESLPIAVPRGDPFFDPQHTGTQTIPFLRSLYAAGSSPRQQVNEITAWLDASAVYGSDAAREAALRTNDGTGRLETSAGNLLPKNTDGLENAPNPADTSLFLAGDIRANEQVGLLALHTLFVREHNRLAGLLRARFPSASGDAIYQGARRIVTAEIQVITYREFLPVLLGPNALAPYAGYKANLSVGIHNAFATAGYRLGHSLVSPTLLRLDAQGNSISAGALGLKDAFFAPTRLTEGGGIEPLLRGAARQVCQDLDPRIQDGLRNFLFGPPGAGGLDLASLNIQRGRDHGLPGYNEARRQLGLTPRTSFAQITSDTVVQARLAAAYTDVDQVDLWTGGLCEDHLPGALVGELFFTLVKRQFELLRDGDRFFYGNQFSGAALTALQNTRLIDVIRRNTTIASELQDDVFTGQLLAYTENDLTIRAVTTAGETAESFTGMVRLSTSDGLLPLHGLVVEITAADKGQVVLPELAFFRTVGEVVVTATSLEPAPKDISGSLRVQVGLQDPVIHPEPPSQLAEGGALTLQGQSFPGQVVELLVDGKVVASTTAGTDGSYQLSATLPPGTQQIAVRAHDPASGQTKTSQAFTVVVPAPTTQALTVEPGSFALAKGQAQQLRVTRLRSNGTSEDVTQSASFSSSNAQVASVSSDGVVRSLTPGAATITVSFDGAQATAQLTASSTMLFTTSPVAGEDDVAVTRETVLRFTGPLQVASVTSQAIYAEFAGNRLGARLHVSPDHTRVTLFYSASLPASARVRVTIDGGLLLDAAGAKVDADQDGAAGGVARIDFETLSLTTVPGTAICGRIFASELAPVGTSSVNVPLEGVRITVDGAESTLFAVTDAGGNFRLEPAPSGRFFVHVDGKQATQQVPPGAYYPTVGKAWESKPGAEINVGDVYLPLVVPGTLGPVSQTQDTVISFPGTVLAQHPELQGVQVTVPKDSLFADDGTRGGQVGIAPVPPDRLPGPLPGGFKPALVITVQTNGPTNFDQPVPVRFPNLRGLAPGAKSALWSFNHDSGKWQVVGSLTVSADGKYLVSDPGTGILAPGWHGTFDGTTGIKGLLGKLGSLISSFFVEDDQETKNGHNQPKVPCNVSVHSGEETFAVTDLAIPGRGQIHFRMTRRYRSRIVYDGPLGHGWDFVYNERLERNVKDGGVVTQDIRRADGTGRLDVWALQPDGSYKPPKGHYSTLVRLQDGSFVLREPNGLKHYYHSLAQGGRLARLEDRHGNRMLFEYDEFGALDLVIDPYGREIDFQFENVLERIPWNGDPSQNPGGILDVSFFVRRLKRVVDFAGREVVYDYNELGQLISVRSPVVTGTSTANDFPNGRVEKYTYTSGFQDVRFNHNILTRTLPEEVAQGGTPTFVWTYGATRPDTTDTELDRVIVRTRGGTNASGVEAGGQELFFRSGLPNPSLIPNPPPGAARVVIHTDRNGNVTQYFFDSSDSNTTTRRLTRGLRPGEPAYFETRSEYNADGLLTRRIHPAGNEVRYRYGSGSRAANRNLVEVRRVADGTRGGGQDLVTTFSYEPLHNRLASITDPRGNSTSYTPPLGSSSAARYTTTFHFDYQEGNAPIPDAVTFGIDLSGVQRGLGDLNGDGRTDQVAGNVVRTVAPSVLLATGSNEANRLGSTTQTIVSQAQWNDQGQVLRRVDAEGNVTTYAYYPDDNPHGESGFQLPFTPFVLRTGKDTGYLAKVVVDAENPPGRTTTAPPAQLTTRFQYDLVGNLTAVQNPRGFVTTFARNALNEVVVTTRDASASFLDGTSRTGVLNYKIRTHYDHNGRVTKTETENRDGNTPGVGPWIERTFVYDILNNPVSASVEVDAFTTLTTLFRYDPNENLVLVQQPEGNRVRTFYDERDLPFAITRGAGASSTESGGPFAPGPFLTSPRPPDLPEAWTGVQVGDPSASSTIRIDYDLNRNRRFVHDAQDNNGDGNPETTAFLYDGFDRLTQVVDALGNRSEVLYDVNSNAVRRRFFGHKPGDPGGVQALLREVFFQHDELNRVFRTDQKLLDVTATGFTTLRPVQLLDQNGDSLVTALFEFDALSRPTFTVEDDGQKTQTVYDGASRAIERIDALGNKLQTAYDENNNPTAVSSVELSPESLVPNETFTTRYVFDALDRLTRATDNAGQTTRFGYDSRDNLVFRSDPEGPLTADPLGKFPGPGQSGLINAAGNTKRWSYDGLDRQLSVVCDLRQGGTGAGKIDTSNPKNPDGQVFLLYQWDKNSRLKAIVDDNLNKTEYFYDDLDRKSQQKNADGKSWFYGYDKDHNVVQVTDPNGTVVQKTYDVLNRLTQSKVSTFGPGVVGSGEETFEYDGLSRLTKSSDDNGGPATVQTSEYVYDSLSRVLEERQNGKPISNTWRGDGVRLKCTLPGGRVLNYAYDTIDRINQVSDIGGSIWEAKFIGPANDYRELTRTFGNGTSLSFLTGNVDTGYDAIKRVVRARHLLPNGTAFVDRSYTYNRADMRLSEKRHDDGAQEDRYVYDSLYRVTTTQLDQGGTGVRRDLKQIAYQLDGVGNRRKVDLTRSSTGTTPVSEIYTVNVMNEYASKAGVPRNHSDNGNLKDDGKRAYQYDYKNRLVAVWEKGPTVAQDIPLAVYQYYADNRRAKKIVFSTTQAGVVVEETQYYYDDWDVCEEQNASGLTKVSYVVSPVRPDEIVQIQRTAAHPLGMGTFYTHRNARGDVVAVTGTSGNVVEKRYYDDYGRSYGEDKQPVAGSAVGNPYGFQGRRLDPETGLYYFRNRYYDPATGRFLTRDPVWDPGNFGNQYSFVGNGPVSKTDPTGELGPLAIFWGIAKVAGAGAGIGGLSDWVAQAVTTCGFRYGNFDWGGFATAIGKGAFGGAIAGTFLTAGMAMGGGLLAGMAVDSVGGLLTAGMLDLAAGKTSDELNPTDYLLAAVLGPGGRLFGAAGKNYGPGWANRPLLGPKAGSKAGLGKAQAANKSAAAGSSKGKGGGCFLAETLVEAKEGRKRIEEVRVGDLVLSRDPATGEQGYKRVVRLFRGHTDQVVYLKIAKAPATQRGRSESHRVGEASGGSEESDEPPLPSDDTQTIRCTTEHPFWVVGQGFVAAKDLRVGQRGLDSKGNEVVYVAVEVRQEEADHYNFEVEDFHTYFVSETEDDPAVWVHNKCPVDVTPGHAPDIGVVRVGGHKPPGVAVGKRSELPAPGHRSVSDQAFGDPRMKPAGEVRVGLEVDPATGQATKVFPAGSHAQDPRLGPVHKDLRPAVEKALDDAGMLGPNTVIPPDRYWGG